jgi:hypothetical protein
MKPLDFHPDAADEARDVAAHYLEIRAELGVDFQRELDAALARIQDNPLAHRQDDLRRNGHCESPAVRQI